MSIVGIIAEFNPMHYGHKYLIDKAKELTHSDTAICIMSGNFTQAGNIALQDKFTRAKIAINNGFDAVIELPTIYATSSAEFFAKGAIEILNNLPIDYLCFGSETGNIGDLKAIATTLVKNSDNIWESILESLKEGISFAKARGYALSKFLTKEQLETATFSNNILAIEYVKNLMLLNSKIKPIAIKRELDYSATSIREKIKTNENIDNLALDANAILSNPLINDNIFKIIKYKIVSMDISKLKEIHEATEGLENKLLFEINNSNTYNKFIQNVKSKRYQLSKIKRILVNILLDITKEDFLELNNKQNVYAHILAINGNKKNEILSQFSKSNIQVITRINDDIISSMDNAISKSLKLDIKASNIYSIIKEDAILKDYTNKL